MKVRIVPLTLVCLLSILLSIIAYPTYKRFWFSLFMISSACFILSYIIYGLISFIYKPELIKPANNFTKIKLTGGIIGDVRMKIVTHRDHDDEKCTSKQYDYKYLIYSDYWFPFNLFNKTYRYEIDYNKILREINKAKNKDELNEIKDKIELTLTMEQNHRHENWKSFQII